ncbi:hypothetical protein EDD11_001196 [Mortierella claussenii]|nr:hypothetical protein EDD11_001196 [Mortierella claussenii]
MSTSYWDALPVETVLGICRFLPSLDLLNICAAYPAIEHLILSTGTLWRTVHLPFPDPLLYSYPGWRRCSFNSDLPGSLAIATNTHFGLDLEAARTTGGGTTIFQDHRYHFLSEPDYFDLPDIEGGELDYQDVNTAWIILDVLGKVPLRYVRHLSFGNPPCHLCVYPCGRTCECDCHPTEHPHHYHYPGIEIPHDPLPPLSQPMQDLLELGVVDFGRHIDLRSLTEALTAENINTGSSSHGYPREITDNGAQFIDMTDDHAHAVVPSSSIMDTDDLFADKRSEEELEQNRWRSETRVSYQRARLLIRILSLDGLESLETLRAPWWPATRIYTIRQQLERWSFLIEQSLATAEAVKEGYMTDEVVGAAVATTAAKEELDSTVNLRRMQEDSIEDVAADTHQITLVPWRARWTNSLPTSSRAFAPMPAGGLHPAVNEGQPRQAPLIAKYFPPLPNLSKFTLRAGGEVVSHERHSIGASVLVLSGRSSVSSSLSNTPSDPSASSETAADQKLSTPCRPTFRYCHRCGSQYLDNNHTSDTSSISGHGKCFC